MALTELSRYLPRPTHHTRFLRSGVRARQRESSQGESIEHMPPGAPPLPSTER
jgi:putative (di)nucleoside polyphosphate hydrolase